jgi:hypothetical protein
VGLLGGGSRALRRRVWLRSGGGLRLANRLLGRLSFALARFGRLRLADTRLDRFRLADTPLRHLSVRLLLHSLAPRRLLRLGFTQHRFGQRRQPFLYDAWPDHPARNGGSRRLTLRLAAQRILNQAFEIARLGGRSQRRCYRQSGQTGQKELSTQIGLPGKASPRFDCSESRL